jgi:hypothetical protein
MADKEERLHNRLIGKLPDPANSAGYRREVDQLLQKNEKAFLREKWGSRALWFFCIALATMYLWFSGDKLDSPKAAWFGCIACFWTIIGAVEVLKHFINRSRVELLKEVKQVQLQVLEVQAELQRRSPAS